MFCSVLQRVAACCSMLQRVVACCSVSQRVAAFCRVSQHVALFLQCVNDTTRGEHGRGSCEHKGVRCVAACCGVL